MAGLVALGSIMSILYRTLCSKFQMQIVAFAYGERVVLGRQMFDLTLLSGTKSPVLNLQPCDLRLQPLGERFSSITALLFFVFKKDNVSFIGLLPPPHLQNVRLPFSS